ncbi:sensor histidine kinase [Chitinophagaceae bacterium MMS25-I14]
MKYLFFIAFNILTVLQVSARLPLKPQPVFIHYNSFNSSLPTETIYKIVPDNFGYIWLATDRGLVKYNGKEFKIVATGKFEDIVFIYRTNNNLLWLFTYSGHTRAVNLNNHVVVNTDSVYGLNKLQLPVRPYILAMQWGNRLILRKQSIRSSISIDLAAHTCTIVPDLAQQIVEHYRLSHLANSRQIAATIDTILLKKNIGIYTKENYLIIGNKIFVVKEHADPVLLFDGDDYNISDYIESAVRHEDDLYLGGLKSLGLIKINGFFSLPGKGHIVEHILPKEQITDIQNDYLNNIWVSSYDNGVFFFPASETQTLYYNKNISGLYSDNVSMLKHFDSGITVIGYGEGVADFINGNRQQRFSAPVRERLSGVLFAEKMKDRWLLFTRMEAFGSNAADGAGILSAAFRPLVPREPGIAQGYKNGALLNNVFYYASGSGILFIDSSGVVCRYAPANFNTNKKTCILPLANGKIYIGTVQGCFLNSKPLPYLADNQFNSIHTSEGLIIFCTNTGAYTIPEQFVFNSACLKRITSDAAYDVKQDSQYLYVRNSNEEVVIVNKKTWAPVNILSLKKYYIPFKVSDFYIDEKYIALAGNRGIFCIPKVTLLDTSGHTEPIVHILSSIYGFSPYNSVFECTYDKKFSASFELDIMTYKNESRQITYRILKDGNEIYRREGISEFAQMNFQPVSPGKYRIEYRVDFGHPAISDKVVSFTIIVLPAWYQQSWFLFSIVILSAVLLFYSVYKINSYLGIRNEAKLKQDLYIYELEARSLLGQLKPHFIFNLLTPLQRYFLKEQKIEGLVYLNSFSGLMRGILMSVRNKYPTLQAELNFAKDYLDVQQKRFGNCFTYTINIAADITPADYIVPALLIQPLLENAVEYGIKKDSNDGIITISITIEKNSLMIIIADNGIGLPADFLPNDGHALTIIAERMALLRKTYGTGSLQIVNNAPPSSGVSAILYLPTNIMI